MDIASPAFWIQLGSTGALALLVLLELRQVRPVLAGVREVLAALLERERIRSERKREPSAEPPSLRNHSIPVHVEKETTDLYEIIERQRKRGDHGHR